MKRMRVNVICKHKGEVLDILMILFPEREGYVIPELTTYPTILKIRGLDWTLKDLDVGDSKITTTEPLIDCKSFKIALSKKILGEESLIEEYFLEEEGDSEIEVNSSFERLSLRVDIDWTPRRFWSILPALNINLHSHSFEFEWLCLGVYISREKEEELVTE